MIPNGVTLYDYTHPSNRFSIKYPFNWETLDRADGVIFAEPGDAAGYSVVFSDVGKRYTPQELNQYLVTFVAQNFAGEGSNFKAISQEEQPDGSIVAQFSTTDPNLGQIISQLQVQQDQTIVFTLHFSTTEEQWDVTFNKLQEITKSFKPIDVSSAIKVEATDEAPIWELIGPENKEFGFFYADNWEIVNRDENSITVREPSLNLEFSASNFAWPNSSDPKAAEEAALQHIETLSEQFSKVQHLPPATFPLDTATGATIDFTFADDNGALMAGSVITALNKNKMHKIVFTAPAEPVELYDVALQWFNPMYKSFKFLSPEDFLQETEPQ